MIKSTSENTARPGGASQLRRRRALLVALALGQLACLPTLRAKADGSTGPIVVNLAELALQPSPAAPVGQAPPPLSHPAAARALGPLLSVSAARALASTRLQDASGGFQSSSGGYLPGLRTNFAGVTDDTEINAFPPDTIGAVGLEHVMVTLNSEVAVMNRQGQVLSKVTLANFWSSFGHKIVFDPKVIYDHLANRWVFVALADPRTTNSALMVAASQSSDPTANWSLYNIPAIPPPDPRTTNLPPQVWLDYPNLGYNQQWFVASVNRTSLNVTNESEAGATASIFAFDKSSLYQGAALAYTNLLDPQFTVVPAVCFDNNPTNFYLVTEAPTLQEGIVSQLRISQIQGTVGQEKYLTNIPPTPAQPQWNFSPGQTNFAAQLGTPVKIYCNDSRLQSCVLRQGTLWCVHHIFLPAGPDSAVTRCAVQWWQINTNGAVLQRGRLDDPTGQTNYIFPSLAVNRSNAVLIGYTRVATNQYASAAFSFRLADDAPNTLRPETLFKAGLAPYTLSSPADRQTRWGDFSGTVVDPMNDVDMWTLQEYAEVPQNNLDRWGTWWGYVGFQPQAPPLFAQGPLSQPVWTFGTNVTLTLQLQGTEPFAYQWLFNGANLAGATNANLTLTNFQPVNVGSYSVLASNVAGFARSTSASLTVVPVDIANQPTNFTVHVNSNAVFSVTASGTQPFFYQWRFQDTNGSPARNVAGATNATLMLTNCQATNQGSYSVQITNAVSSILSAQATLTVQLIKPPLLSGFVILPDGTTQMLISCEPNSTLSIQFANDLGQKPVVWTELINFLTASGNVQFQDPTAGGDFQRYYRVILTR